MELITRQVAGLQLGGRSSDVIEAWKDLAGQGVVGIYGPWVSENAIALRSYIESEGRVPSLSMTGTDRWYGEWCFAINNGSLPEDPYLLTNYMVTKGYQTVGLGYDRSAIGQESRASFQEAVSFDGLEIVAECGIATDEQDPIDAVRRLKAAGPDAVAYLGYGIAAPRLSRAMESLDWDPPRVMASCFMTAPFIPDGIQSIRGWIGIDQYDEENAVGQAFLDPFEKRHGYRPANFFALMNYDFGVMITQALSRSFPLSPEGFKTGLERVKMLPAANGGSGALLSFGPFIRRAWLSPHFILMREVDPAAGDVDLLGGPGTILRHKYRPVIRRS